MQKFFIITGQDEANLASLLEYAEAHPFSIEMLEEVIAGKREIPGDTPQFTRFMQIGKEKVVFTVQHQKPGTVRQMSMSVPVTGKLPPIRMVQEIMKILGFTKELNECHTDLEEIGKNHQAVSIIEVIEKKE